MDRSYEKWLGTALVGVGLGLLLFGFLQAYIYTQSPPAGQYPVVTLGGGGGANGFQAQFNGRFLEAFTFLGIEYLVGASVLRAGWNLISPKAETIQVRVKPRSLQVEDASATPAGSAPVPSRARIGGPAPAVATGTIAVATSAP